MDLIAVLQLSSASKLDATLVNMMKIYGFVPRIFTRDEFHFYLDSLFSGIITTAVTKGQRVPLKELRGKRIKDEDISNLISEIFEEGEDLLERQVFVDRVLAHADISGLFKYFQEAYTESSKYCKKRAMELIQVSTSVRTWVYEMVKDAVYKAEGEPIQQK